jgi:2-methylcitrate dehydratase PrpD
MTTEAQKPLTERLAEKIVGFDKSQATKPALKAARTAIIDTVGVTLAGIPEPCTQILLDTPGVATSPGSSLIFGTSKRTSALDAALVNGTASHALDYDDFSGALGGHQSVPLVPALYALAEERKLGGQKLLLAYIIGVEVEIRLARAVHNHHYDKGWHPTATLGVFGAAAAVSHLLGFDQEKTATALAIAASHAAGLKANFGTMVKPLHIGQTGRAGLLSALLAERGFTANKGVFEHHQGFLKVYNGDGTHDVERAFANWGDPLEIANETIGLKQFPCCGSTHAAIFMMQAIRNDEGVKADDVAKIELLPHGRRLRHTNTPDPQTNLQAKFSVQYACARMLLDGAVRLKDFEGDAHFEPEIQRLLKITEAHPHPDMADDAELQWGAEVIVTLKDGRKISRRVENMVGRGGEFPMTTDELWEKFDDCARRALPRDQIAPLFERLETIDSVTDMAQVSRLLTVSELHDASRANQKITFAHRNDQEAEETTWVP